MAEKARFDLKQAPSQGMLFTEHNVACVMYFASLHQTAIMYRNIFAMRRADFQFVTGGHDRPPITVPEFASNDPRTFTYHIPPLEGGGGEGKGDSLLGIKGGMGDKKNLKTKKREERA